MSVTTAIVDFVVAVLGGGGAALLAVAVSYRPFRTGPTSRIAHLIQAGTLLALLGYAWAAAFGLVKDMAGQPWELTYGIAIGATVAGGWLYLRRRRRYRRSLPPKAAPGSQVHATPPTAARAPLTPAGRVVQVVIRSADYAMGVLFCSLALGGGAELSNYVRADAARWFTGTAHLSSMIATHVVLAASGFCYAQLISGAAFRAMNMALEHDWQISRKWHYVLLAPPFVWTLPICIIAPGMLLGILSHLVTLWAGWRYTTERPTTTLRTVKAIRERRRLARAAVGG
jgi:hypothetical protein